MTDKEQAPNVGDALALTSVVEKQDIRAVTMHFHDGPVEGYEWRLLVKYPATRESGPRSEWTAWVFGSRQSVDAMLAQWRQYILLTTAKLDKPTQ